MTYFSNNTVKLTTKWLKEQGACAEGIEWFEKQKETCLEATLKALMDEGHFDWANWVMVQKMSHKKQIQYAVFAAEQVIDIWEKKYPADKRPRQAIRATRSYLANPAKGKKVAAAAYAANAAAAYAAAYAAAAANAAAYAAYAAHAAAAAANAADARKNLQEEIIAYGLELLKEVRKNGV